MQATGTPAPLEVSEALLPGAGLDLMGALTTVVQHKADPVLYPIDGRVVFLKPRESKDYRPRRGQPSDKANDVFTVSAAGEVDAQ